MAVTQTSLWLPESRRVPDGGHRCPWALWRHGPPEAHQAPCPFPTLGGGESARAPLGLCRRGDGAGGLAKDSEPVLRPGQGRLTRASVAPGLLQDGALVA